MAAALKNPEVKLRKRSPGWWRVFLYLGYYAGLRRGEILGMTWEQIDFDRLEIQILAETSKSHHDRVVPMTSELAELFRGWKEMQGQQQPQDKVLPWPWPTYRQLYIDWRVIQAAARIPEGQRYVPKNCRSSCASGLIASGVPTAVVRDFLGHRSVQTTEKFYTPRG